MIWKVSLIVLGSSLSLLLWETLLAFFPTMLPVSSPDHDRQSCCDYHPYFGYWGIPGREGSIGYAPFKLNSFGTRGRTLEQASYSTARRILLLGDSQAWGFGLKDTETLAAQIESVSARAAKRTEVYSVAQPGFSTDQELLTLLEYGRRVVPEAVVLVYFADNDLDELISSRSWRAAKPRFQLSGDSLCLTEVPVPMNQAWPRYVTASASSSVNVKECQGVLNRSHLYRHVRKDLIQPSALQSTGCNLLSATEKRSVRGLVAKFKCDETLYGENDKLEIFSRTMQQIRAYTRLKSIRLLVVIKPLRNEVFSAIDAEETKSVRRILDALNIEVFNVRNTSHTRAVQGRIFLSDTDDHLNARSVTDVAENIVEILSSL